MKISHFLSKAIATVSLVGAFSLVACDSEMTSLRFGSGNKGGFYHKYAINFARAFNSENKNPQVQVKMTSGSSANIRLLEDDFLDLAIVQGDILQDHLLRSRVRCPIAAVGGLYTESIQIIVAADSDIKTVADLAGHRISVGEEESGVLRNAEIILNAYGISFDKIEAKNLSFKDAADALTSGEIDALFCTAGVPTPSIQMLARNMKIRVLSLDEADLSRIMNLHGELTSSTILANTYPGQDSAVLTLGTKAILVASLLADNATIQKVAENAFLQSTQAMPAEAINIQLDFSTTNIPVEFHPGAAAFYASKGINVPEAAPLQGRQPTPSTGD